MVPEGWSVGQVKDFLFLQRGFDLTAKQAVNGNIPVYSSSGLAYFHNESKVQGPGIVTGRKGSVGPVYLVNEDFWPHDTTLWVKDFKGNNIKYIEYFLNYLKLERFDEASSVPTLNRNNVHGIKCVFPPPPEQKKIAKILSTWDKAITTTEQLLANSQQQKKSLTQQLLTGKKRLGLPAGSYQLQRTRYGLLPKNWEYPAIKDICVQVSEKNSESFNHPVLSCSKHAGFIDSLKYFNKKVYSDDTSGYRLIYRGCFGFPSNHIEEGSIGLQNLYDTGIVSPIYVVFRAKQSKVNNAYLYAVLKTDHYRQIFGAATNASVDRRGSLRWKEFGMIHVPLPPLEEQQKIAEVLSIADQEVTALQQKLAALKQEKKALMQQLLTAKRRVKLDNKEVA